MTDGLAAVERITEQLENADVEVRSLRDCGTTAEGDHVHATIEVLAPVDALRDEADGDTSAEQDTATGDTDANDGSPPEAKGDNTPETRCGDTGDPNERDGTGASGAPDSADLTDLQRDIVQALQQHGECRPGELAEDVDTTQGTVSRYLRDFVDEGLVTRRKDPDDGRRTLYRVADGQDGATEDAVADIDWLDEHPAEIVSESPARRTLEEVLTVVDTADSIIDIQQRLALGQPGAARDLLTDLGLTIDETGGVDQSDDRLAVLRQLADGQEVADA